MFLEVECLYYCYYVISFTISEISAVAIFSTKKTLYNALAKKINETKCDLDQSLIRLKKLRETRYAEGIQSLPELVFISCAAFSSCVTFIVLIS